MQRKSNHQYHERNQGRHPGPRVMPQAWHERCNFLQLAGPIWGHGHIAGVLYLNNLISILKPFLVLILIVTSVSCTTTGNSRLDSTGPARQVADFSGDWEKNYQRSDSFEIVFKNYILNIQSQINALQEDRNRNSSINADSAIRFSRESISGLAQFTEEITRMPLLHIVQDKTRVKINQKDDFALQCKFFEEQVSSKKNPYGIENCSWNRGQLFIQINLQNGLSIFHQVTLAPDAQELNITTTIVSREATFPLTVSNYYRRYTPPENDFNCIQTLTRNDVCKKLK